MSRQAATMTRGAGRAAPAFDTDDAGIFSGYATIFGRADLGGDLIEPGAFAASLRRRGPGGIRMLFQHNPAEPIGVWAELREDGRGLFARGRLALDVGRARDVFSLMRAGALDGLSIGFRAVRARRAGGVRRLIEIDLWEVSVVTFPMLPEARVGLVKGAEASWLASTIRRAAGSLTPG